MSIWSSLKEKLTHCCGPMAALLDREVNAGLSGGAEEEAVFKEKGREAAFALVQFPFEDLLISETVRPVLPDYAPITESVICPNCDESVMAAKVVTKGKDRGLCLMCAGRQYRQVEGQGIVARGRRKRPVSTGS